jgi:hypothetical protein
MAKDPHVMVDEEIRKRILNLAFYGDERLLETFCEKLRTGLPPGTAVALRGSVVTNARHEDGKPFDASGEGTSDLDITLIGSEVMEHWEKDAFYIPKLHTKPLSDQDSNVAPSLNQLRQELQRIVRRPVSFQATANMILFARDVLFDQPYYLLIKAGETS